MTTTTPLPACRIANSRAAPVRLPSPEGLELFEVLNDPPHLRPASDAMDALIEPVAEGVEQNAIVIDQADKCEGRRHLLTVVAASWECRSPLTDWCPEACRRGGLPPRGTTSRTACRAGHRRSSRYVADHRRTRSFDVRRTRPTSRARLLLRSPFIRPTKILRLTSSSCSSLCRNSGSSNEVEPELVERGVGERTRRGGSGHGGSSVDREAVVHLGAPTPVSRRSQRSRTERASTSQPLPDRPAKARVRPGRSSTAPSAATGNNGAGSRAP